MADSTLFESRRWREGRHWQIEVGRLSAWVGIKTDRLMVGVVFNTDSLTFGVGIGPVYFGIGAAEPTLFTSLRWRVGDFIGRWVSVRLGSWIEGPLR